MFLTSCTYMLVVRKGQNRWAVSKCNELRRLQMMTENKWQGDSFQQTGVDPRAGVQGGGCSWESPNILAET